MLRRPLRFLFACLLILPLSVVFAGEWSPDEVRAILAERIDEHEQSVGIAVGLVDENGSTVVGYGRLSEDDVRVPDGKTVAIRKIVVARWCCNSRGG